MIRSLIKYFINPFRRSIPVVAFSIAKKLNSFERQIELIPNRFYNFKGERVKLLNIQVTHSFSCYKSFNGKIVTEPTNRVNVSILMVPRQPGLIQAQWQTIELSEFIKNLVETYQFESDLIAATPK
jgi:hypothetical protein